MTIIFLESVGIDMTIRNLIKEILSESIESWANAIETKYGRKAFHVYEHKDYIKLDTIIVGKENQGNGVGTKVLNELCEYADRLKKRIVLTPGLIDKRHGTTSQSRLIEFYKRFGFILNKGRNKDFTISELTYREPK